MSRYTLHLLQPDGQSTTPVCTGDGPAPVVQLPAPVKAYLTSRYGDTWSLHPGWYMPDGPPGHDCWVVRVRTAAGAQVDVGMIEYQN